MIIIIISLLNDREPLSVSLSLRFRLFCVSQVFRPEVHVCVVKTWRVSDQRTVLKLFCVIQVFRSEVHVCVVKTGQISDQADRTEVLECHQQKTGWRRNEFQSKGTDVPSKE